MQDEEVLKKTFKKLSLVKRKIIMALLETISESFDPSKLLTSLLDVGSGIGGDNELLRALPGTAVGGIALAVIGMILEFITLSGFHPAVS